MNNKTSVFSKSCSRAVAMLLAVAMVLSMVMTLDIMPVKAEASVLLSQNKPAVSSSVEGPFTAKNVVDMDMNTRWASEWAVDPQWVSIDLGSTSEIDRVVLNWEGAYGKAYDIQVSDDAANWTTVYSTANGDGGIDEFAVSGSGRYVRMYGTQRALAPYGYSLYEFQVYGIPGSTSETPAPTAAPDTTPAPTTAPDITPVPTAVPTATPAADTPNIAKNRPAAVSSQENGSFTPDKAVDGDMGSRWASEWGVDPQWISVDLGAKAEIDRIVLKWEGAYSKAYEIQVSEDGNNWTSIYAAANGDGGTDEFAVSGIGRYVRMYSTKRALEAYGCSLFEFEVHGILLEAIQTPPPGQTPNPANTSSPSPTATPNPNAPTTPNLTLNRTAYASSTQGSSGANLAVDGSSGSRWESAWGVDPQWIYVDLGAQAEINRVIIKWEGAYAKAFKIQTSDDELNWTDIYTTNTCNGGTSDIAVSGNGRYVRLLCTQRALANYGVSVFEFAVYGNGGVNTPPPNYGANIALNKETAASSIQRDWYIKEGDTDAKNVVDGNANTRWGGNMSDPQWIYVDLGSTHTIGRVILNWEAAAARTFDIQVSDDAQNWTTVYRETKGIGGIQNIPLYAEGRYVRMYGISRATTFGYSMYEFEIYDYIDGEPKSTYTIPELPTPSTVTSGGGSYLVDDITMPQPRIPAYKTSDITGPLPSNDWWQSIMIEKLSSGVITLPLKSKFTQQGLSILNPGIGWTDGGGGSINAAGNPDLYLTANNINTASMESKVSSYSDWSATAILSDDDTAKMKVTFVKGSPYIFSEFSDSSSPVIYSPIITRFFDDNNNAVLVNDGDSITADHIGMEITNTDGSPAQTVVKRYYGVNAPEGTVFMKVGAKVKIKLGNDEKYLSIAALPAAADLNYFYQHGYAFAADTKVNYNFDAATSKVTTDFNVTTSLKRPGFSESTLMCLMPHQWKLTVSPLTSYEYPSIRGTMKVREGNSFTVVDRFYGIVPQFTEPNDPTYSRQELYNYLVYLDQDTDEPATDLMRGDAYWQGKKLHPMAMGVLIADQLGDTEYKNKFLGRMKTILSDWYTYTQGEPEYFLYYNKDWGTMYYKVSEFGANAHLADHHFTFGYYVFASAVLATYDQDFYNKYGTMVDHLIRDYANPSRTDSMYPFLRSFDPYEGHSWAGGYADNDSGNNQEAAGESLFGWVGQFMWGTLTGNNSYRDTAIFGFTTEEKAIEQYWFNYDHDNWVSTYKHGVAGQVYGSAYLYGTFFSGDPNCIYGIHWLPTAEYLTYYGRDPQKTRDLYNAFVVDKGREEDGWQHIIWPFQAIGDAQAVLDKWDASVQQQNEVFNTYWFVHSMASLGQRTTDVWAANWPAATVYKKDNVYTAQVWNPTDKAVTVTFCDASGAIGSAIVPAKTTAAVNPFAQPVKVETPVISPADGTYESAQEVAISCGTEGAEIRYTTDGSEPTEASALYSAPFTVAETTTIKAKAFKASCINSDTAAVTLTIIKKVETGKVEAESFVKADGAKVVECSEGGQSVSINKNGWIELKVNVQSEGMYTVDFRALLNGKNSIIKIKTDSLETEVTKAAKDEEKNKWVTVSSGAVKLKAGENTIRIYAKANGFELNWIKVDIQK